LAFLFLQDIPIKDLISNYDVVKKEMQEWEAKYKTMSQLIG
jgi:hypothetical protein